jgi:cobyrinic acid a,c-diamide synthase
MVFAPSTVAFASAAVILNQVGVANHIATMLTTALTPLVCHRYSARYPRSDTFHWRDRHLGLVPVSRNRHEIAAALGPSRSRDRTALRPSTRSRRWPALAAPKPVDDPKHAHLVGATRIALATGPAFSFTYPTTSKRSKPRGATIVPFDPCVDRSLPDRCDGHGDRWRIPSGVCRESCGQCPLIDDVRRAARDGLVIWANAVDCCGSPNDSTTTRLSGCCPRRRR